MGIVTIDNEIKTDLNICKAILLTINPQKRATSYQNIIRYSLKDYKKKLKNKMQYGK